MIGTLLRVRYELTQLIDEGPIFVLYRAKDRVTGREINIRLFREPFSSETALIEQVKSVIREFAVIPSGAIERYVDVDEHEGTPFIVSESGTGQSFDERLRRLAPYSVPVAISLAVQILEALVPVHQAGFVHGEVSSKNILVGPDGKVSLLQPGMWSTYGGSRLAGPAVLPSIAPYLAPEISEGKMPSPAGDVYAVGILLFEMLTGRRPFTGATPIEQATKHMTAPVPSVRATNPSVSVPFEELVKKALSKDPNVRYASSKAMLADLKVLQDAVRFGKPVQWPLTPVPTAPAASGAPATPSTTPATVQATKAGPKRYEPPKAAAMTQANAIDEVTDKLPRWITLVWYVIVCSLILMVGGWVYWNVTQPKPIQVPDLVGMQVAQAQAQLKGQRVSIRELRREYSERQPEGIILKTDPAKGEQVREGTSIGAVISSGSKFVTVPDLRGRTLDEARSLLNGMDLVINEPIERERSRQIAPGKVLRTVPEARSRIERNTRVRITISSEQSEDFRSVASIRGSYVFRMSVPASIERVTVRVDITDANGVRTLHEQEHKGGESIVVEANGFGDPVYFKVFFNGDLVKSVEKSPSRALGEQ